MAFWITTLLPMVTWGPMMELLISQFWPILTGWMMMALKRAGKLTHLAGLIIGGMTAMNDNSVPFGKTAEEIIAEHVSEFDYPVCFGFPAGHIRDNRAICFGRSLSLKIEKTVRLL